MSNTDKLTPTQRITMLNAIAERDQIIEDKDKQIAEKDRLISHYKKQYECAVRQRMRERHERLERRKDIIAFTIMLLVISFVFIPIMVGAFRETILWASGM